MEHLGEVQGLVFAIDQTATHDGPGLRMTVYLKGCPLRCVWCHSPESICPKPELVWYQARCDHCGTCTASCTGGAHTVEELIAAARALNLCESCGECIESCPQGALEIKGRTMTAGEVFDEAHRLMPFFRRTGGGVTLTGGEPTLQTEFAYAILALCREAGIHTAVETSGFTTWERLQRLATVTDLFLYDLKHADEEAHRALTGVSLSPICENLRRLVDGGADVLVRVPVIPGCNGSPTTLRDIGRRAHEAGARRISLLPFNPAAAGKYAWLDRPYPLEGTKRQSDAEMRALEELLREDGLTVVST